MILVDTSVWIDHIRSGDALLFARLSAGDILCHPYVIGELAMGDPRQFDSVIEQLTDLPQAIVATDSEVVYFVRQKRLFATGLGYIDAHLLAAVTLMPGSRLWTRDKRLRRAAAELGIAAAL